jgi:hypothetical protein
MYSFGYAHGLIDVYFNSVLLMEETLVVFAKAALLG